MNSQTLPAFVLDTQAPILRNAYYLGFAAKAVYWDNPGEICPALTAAFPHVVTFQRNRIFGYAAANSTDVVVAFRGTKNDQAWLEGIAYGQVDSPPGRVHKGLADALDGVWLDLMAALFDTNALDKTLWLAGHSLGGCLSTLAARRLRSEGFEPFLLCTYGTPRVLDSIAARAFETPSYRFVNNEDAIPDFPWPTLFDTYVHTGELVRFMASGRIAEARHSEHLARRLDRAETIGEGILPAGMLHDHRMDAYLSKLERHV